MNQSTNRNIGVQLQINNGPQTANGQFQGALNINVQLLRLQNTANRFNRNFIANQTYSDLVNGTNPFASMQVNQKRQGEVKVNHVVESETATLQPHPQPRSSHAYGESNGKRLRQTATGV
ncbi:hypothetical protein C2G38_2186161 [Gigaspora rosea]|uniref:Uncharacterized protein n=1 Tax=Gigaspora rosea TaxID=44941 RepID=A0A397V627_9GLOM|nr:hypothetical protein C2G38_2186161 [Gigaspora rosea]